MHTLADPRLQAVVSFFESLSPTTLPQLADLYAADAQFVDPFNDVTGLPAIHHIFDHMFKAVDAPRFAIQSAIGEVVDGQLQAFLAWDFTFNKKGLPRDMCIHGASRLVFDANGKIKLHRDYWDAVQELYAKLPVVGAIARWLARQFKTPS